MANTMMENYELDIYIPLQNNPITGCFLKNHVPFNRGIPMKNWMDGRKIKKVMKCLELGRILGHPELAGSNRIPVVGIKDGKLYPFDSAVTAAKILKAKGVKVCSRNICNVCHCKTVKNHQYEYTRKHAGGFRWFFASDVDRYKNAIV